MIVLLIKYFEYSRTISIEPTGEILFSGIGENSGIYVLDIKNGSKKRYLDKQGVIDPIFIDSNNILFMSLSELSNEHRWYSEINKYNLIGEKIDKIALIPYEIEYPYLLSMREASFIDNNKNVHIYDLENKQDTILKDIGTLDDESRGVSWDKDFGSIIYSSQGKVYKYNYRLKQKVYITNGLSPVLSSDYENLAYVSDDESKNLVIMDLSTGQKRSLNVKDVVEMVWSPDDKYIACIQASDKFYSDNLYNLLVIEIASGTSKKYESFRGPRRISWI